MNIEIPNPVSPSQRPFIVTIAIVLWLIICLLIAQVSPVTAIILAMFVLTTLAIAIVIDK